MSPGKSTNALFLCDHLSAVRFVLKAAAAVEKSTAFYCHLVDSSIKWCAPHKQPCTTNWLSVLIFKCKFLLLLLFLNSVESLYLTACLSTKHEVGGSIPGHG